MWAKAQQSLKAFLVHARGYIVWISGFAAVIATVSLFPPISSNSPLCLTTKGILNGGLFLFVPVVISILLVHGIRRLYAGLQGQTPSPTSADLPTLLPLACTAFGAGLGVLMGLNKGPLATAIFPAILTVVCFAITFLIKNRSGLSAEIPAAILALGVSLPFGVLFGSAARAANEAIDLDIALHKSKIEKFIDLKTAFASKVIETGDFDPRLYNILFGSTSGVDFQFSNAACWPLI